MGKLGSRTPLAKAEMVAREMQEKVRQIYGVEDVLVAGSVRRQCPFVQDVDLVVVADKESQDASDFPELDMITWTPRGGTADNVDGVRVELYLTSLKSSGAALLHSTGPWRLNVYMRGQAKARGWKLSQHGLQMSDGTRVDDLEIPNWTPNSDFQEHEIFRLLEMPYIPPEERDSWRGWI